MCTLLTLLWNVTKLWMCPILTELWAILFFFFLQWLVLCRESMERRLQDRGKGPPRKALYSLCLLFLCNWSHSTSTVQSFKAPHSFMPARLHQGGEQSPRLVHHFPQNSFSLVFGNVWDIHKNLQIKNLQTWTMEDEDYCTIQKEGEGGQIIWWRLKKY